MFMYMYNVYMYICKFPGNLHIYGPLFYLATAQSWCLIAIRRDSGLSNLCHSYGFACQQRGLKTFPCRGYLHFKDGVV